VIPEGTPRLPSGAEDWFEPENGVEINHTFTGIFEGEGFRISILEGWNEIHKGEFVHATTGGTLTFIAETTENTVPAIIGMLKQMEYKQNNEIIDSRMNEFVAGSFSGIVLSIYLTQNDIPKNIYEYITIENGILYTIRYTAGTIETLDDDLYDVKIIVSTMEID